jgi:hypothetical protein
MIFLQIIRFFMGQIYISRAQKLVNPRPLFRRWPNNVVSRWKKINLAARRKARLTDVSRLSTHRVSYNKYVLARQAIFFAFTAYAYISTIKFIKIIPRKRGVYATAPKSSDGDST